MFNFFFRRPRYDFWYFLHYEERMRRYEARRTYRQIVGLIYLSVILIIGFLFALRYILSEIRNTFTRPFAKAFIWYYGDDCNEKSYFTKSRCQVEYFDSVLENVNFVFGILFVILIVIFLPTLTKRRNNVTIHNINTDSDSDSDFIPDSDDE